MSDTTQPVRSKRTLLWVILGFLAVVSCMYVWKEVSLALLGRSTVKEQKELSVRQEEREAEIRQAFSERSAQLLELTALPLGWAVRTEALEQDLSQIEEYMVHLVKEPMIERLAFVTPDGVIKISTDKKLENEPAARFFGRLPAREKVGLERLADELHLVVPILGYNAKLGSLIVTLDRTATEL